MKATNLTGRRSELAIVNDVLEAAPARGSAILFVGDPGIGKTSLLVASEEVAENCGFKVLRAVGTKVEANLPYAGLHRLLSPLLATTESLPSVQRVGLLTALGLADRGPVDPLIVSLATLNLVGEAAREGGALLSLDDIQWLDSETEHVVAFLARRVNGRGIVIVATASPAHDWRDSTGAFQEQPIAGLEERDASEVLRVHAPTLSDLQHQWVLDRSLGNPVALLELGSTVPADAELSADLLETTVPLTPALERTFAGGLDQLTGPSRDAVLIAALALDDSLQEVLAATAFVTGRSITAATLDEAAGLGLLCYNENRVTFRHPLVRLAVAQQASATRRYAAHRALGAIITVNVRRRTWHRASGVIGCDDVIASELEAQGSADKRRGDVASALWAFQRAADLSTEPLERGRRLLLAAEQAADLGRFDEVESIRAAAVSYELSDPSRIRAELLSEECGVVVSGDSQWIERLSSSIPRSLAVGDRGLAIDVAFAASLHSFRFPLAVDHRVAATITEARLLGEGNHPLIAAARGLINPVENGQSVSSVLESIDAEKISDGGLLFALMLAARAVGSYVRCLEFSERAEIIARTNGLNGVLAQVLCLAADIRFELGDWSRGNVALRESFSLIADSKSTARRAELLVVSAKAAALQGNAVRALEFVAQAELTTSASSGSSVLARAQIARGIAYLALGKNVEAVAVLSRVFDSRDPSHHPNEQFAALSYLAEASVRSGVREGVDGIVNHLEAVHDVSGSRLLLAQLQYTRAVLSDDVAAEDLFAEALASDFAGWPWPRARCQLAFGRWLRRHRQSSRSRGPLTAALDTLEQIGAARWSQEALDELNATNRRSTDDREANPAAACLSAQELRIGRLAAEGLSNSEIGQELCLSPRTVGSHLYRMFPKLGISSRRELASRLGEPIR
jgi:DNA-binding CsgD family transcriptional regulator/tetratricopeptide (TPR) repeat protein